MRRHWMAIPMGVLIPLIAVSMVLADRYHWSDGALGGVLALLFAITAGVGTLMAPDELN